MYINVDSAGLRRLARDLRRAGETSRNRELAKALRKELKPVVAPIRAAIRATPSMGNTRTPASREARPRGLRDGEARGVVVKVILSSRGAEASVRIATRHFPFGSKSVIAYREGVIDRWRVRNWGRDDWHVQRAHPAFFPTLEPLIPGVSERVEAQVSDTVDAALRDGHL
jgi:hypothetical protein